MKNSNDIELQQSILPGAQPKAEVGDGAFDTQNLLTKTRFSTFAVQVVQGHKRLTPHTAVRLEAATGVPAKLWNNLEIQFQERCQTNLWSTSSVSFISIYVVAAIVRWKNQRQAPPSATERLP